MKLCVWLREDLRLDHHPILDYCRKNKWPISILMTISENWWCRHDWGRNRQSAYLLAMQEVQRECRLRNIPCVVLTIKSAHTQGFADEVLQYLQSISIDGLAFTPQYEIREQARDLKIWEALSSQGRKVLSVEQNLLSAKKMYNTQGNPFGVFTPFKNKALQILSQYSFTEAGHLPPLIGDCEAPSLEGDLESAVKRIVPDSVGVQPILRVEALKQLELFADRVLDQYQTSRDWPSHDGTSRLSAALSLGTLGVRETWSFLDTLPNNAGIECFRSELLWREFYQHMLQAHPRLSKNQPYQLTYQNTVWESQVDLQQRWEMGRTGFPIVDAAMNQLRQEGWMHNRMRMLTAMFFTKLLLQPWPIGEKIFAKWLFDYNLAANNGGWQWSASTGVDPVPYFRIMSPWEQTKKFDPDAHYIKKYCPELAGLPAKAFWSAEAFEVAAPRTYPKFCIDYPKARARAIEYYKAQRL